MRPRRSASSHSAGAHPVVAGGGRVALVEDQVDDLEHRRQPRGAARRRAGPRTARCASASVAWRARCAARWSASGTRNARAISSVVRPPSRRSVSATRASGDSTGWQAVKIRRSRSSPTSSSSASRSGSPLGPGGSRARARAPRLLRQSCGAAPHQVDRAVLGGGHQPGARVVRDAGLRPLLERRDERVLGELLGQADVAHDARRARRSAAPTRSARPRRSARVGVRAGAVYLLLAPRSAARSAVLLLAQLGRALRRRSPRPRRPGGSRSRRRPSIGRLLDPLDASSSDLTCKIQKPATSSLVSANGPSMTVCARRRRTGRARPSSSGAGPRRPA